MTFQRTYDDDALVAAVEGARSWRGVLRTLGLQATSAGAMRTARRHADRLGLDYSHFTGQRRWSDAALMEAVANAFTWTAVADALGLKSESSFVTLRAHALRLSARLRPR